MSNLFSFRYPCLPQQGVPNVKGDKLNNVWAVLNLKLGSFATWHEDLMTYLKLFQELRFSPDASLLNESSSLPPTLGVINFITNKAMILLSSLTN